MPIPVPYFPPTATLDHVSDHSNVNVGLGLSSYDDTGPDVGARLSLGGEYLSKQQFGFYGQIDLSYVDGEGDSESAMSNLELGGLYVVSAGANTKVVLRGGLVLPTGPDGDDFGGYIANFATVVPRLTDYAMVGPETTFLRGSVSPLYRQGQFFLRADVGLDVAVDEPEGSDIDPLIRANVALGFQSGPVTVAGELVTLGTTGHVDESEDRFLHTVAVSVGYDAGSVRPYGAVIVPVDYDLTEYLGVNFAVMGGIEVPFGQR